MLSDDADGERLNTQKVAVFFTTLLGAGNKTTRNALAHALIALTQHPDQRAAWFSDFNAHAVTASEEIVGWATPVHSMRRTVVAPTELGTVSSAVGDRVLLVYSSGNRDATVFTEPFRF